MNKEIGLYVHIPFCKNNCTYCDFPKSVTAFEHVHERYLDHLLKELENKSYLLDRTKTVYIGGGTPNSLSLNSLNRLFKALQPYLLNSVENTIEVNCELLTEEQVRLFKEFNINRVSIGVQTFNSNILKIIGRKHDKKTVFKAVELLKMYGLNNINIDMIYGLPKQQLSDVLSDLALIKELNLPHLSYYSLICEEKTILGLQIKNSQLSIPDDDLVADMADKISQELDLTMFKRYEISNYAKAGFESLHNLGYWQGAWYLGVGLGAAGYYEDTRFQNSLNFYKYYQGVDIHKEHLSLWQKKQEFMLLGLRLIKGVSQKEYEMRFSTRLTKDFDLSDLMTKGLLEIEGDNIFIPKNRLIVANRVFEKFVGEDSV